MKYLVLILSCGLLVACSGSGSGGGSGEAKTVTENVTLKNVTPTEECEGPAKFTSPYRSWKAMYRGTGDKTGRRVDMTMQFRFSKDGHLYVTNECDFDGKKANVEVSSPIEVDEDSNTITVLEAQEKETQWGGVTCKVATQISTFKYELVGSCLKGTNKGQSGFFVPDNN